MRKDWDFAVVGGGASGMAAAISAARLGDSVLLLEKSSALGRKISASGNGRCNLMNSGTLVYYGNDDFISSVFHHFSQADLEQFWTSAGLMLTEGSGGRIYPRTLHSSTVLEILKTNLHLQNVDVSLQTAVTGIKKDNKDAFTLLSPSGNYTARRVLIACGGSAYPRLGGTESGYNLLSSFGHRITQPFPALCPLLTDRTDISGLSGIRVRCILSLFDPARNKIFSTSGEVLFTEYGISGICAMQCARFVRQSGYRIELDFTENLIKENESLENILSSRRSQFASLDPEFLLSGILVPKLSFAVIKQSGIPMRGRKTGDLTDQEIRSVASRLRGYSLRITGTRGLDEAQVTAGGASCSEFDTLTLESVIVKGLHASGEVLDIDGDCGGFNMMFATITGILAGMNGRKGMNI